MQSHEHVIELRGVTKDYHGLRPLRVEHLALRQGQTAALLGLDRAAAEVLVNLITAATLPDSGEVEIFGSLTRDITNAEAWFRSLDRFGIFSERVVLVDELNVEQNLALPLSLVVDDIPPDLRSQVRKIADEVGIPDAELSRSMASAGAPTRTRARLGKALALAPRILLAEHPNAAMPPDEVGRLGCRSVDDCRDAASCDARTNGRHCVCRRRMQRRVDAACRNRKGCAIVRMEQLVYPPYPLTWRCLHRFSRASPCVSRTVEQNLELPVRVDNVTTRGG